MPGHELRAVARPSDFMLTHLALFAVEDEDNVKTWAACFDATLQVTLLERAVGDRQEGWTARTAGGLRLPGANH